MPFDSQLPVNESPVFSDAEKLGSSLRKARRSSRLSQRTLAQKAGIDLATVQGMEGGKGTLSPLRAVLNVLNYRFSDHQGPDDFGRWIAAKRKAAGFSQEALASRIGVSKPTIIQIERGRGNIRSLLLVFDALAISPAVESIRDVSAVARIHHGTCLDVMKRLASGSVDLIFTSPPYNLRTSTGNGFKSVSTSGKWQRAALRNGYAGHSDDLPHEEYVAWQKEVLLECWRLLADDGAIFYNHKPRIQGGVLQTPLALNPDLPVRQIVIWKRNGGMNFNNTYFLPTHEWIVVFAKPKWRLKNSAKDVWEIGQEQGNPHPAPFPVALPEMAIMATDAKVILDPFSGSGSTGVAAIRAGRQFIGIEKNEGLCSDGAETIVRSLCGDRAECSSQHLADGFDAILMERDARSMPIIIWMNAAAAPK